MNMFSIVCILLGTALSITNSTIVLIIGENGFSQEIKELLLFFSIIFGLGSVYGIYTISVSDANGSIRYNLCISSSNSINNIVDSQNKDVPKDRYILVEEENENNHIHSDFLYNPESQSPDTIDNLYTIYNFENIGKQYSTKI